MTKRVFRSEYHRPYVYGRPARNETHRFFESAIKSDTLDCIIWPFAKDADGYARLRYGTRSLIASRIVCELVNGKPAAKFYQAAHSCHRPSCINPKHLSWKTPAENCADKIANGTNVYPAKLGELNYSAKLTADDVREIRRLAQTMSQNKIAKLFGISSSSAHMIVTRKHWGHVE